ncbi:MAG: glycosyltransferase [Candidatus Dormibacteria bacterium]
MRASPHICTIIARNYLPAARVLSESFLHLHPEGRVTVLGLDELGPLEPRDRFRVLGLRDIDLGDDINRMLLLYDVMELSTAVKPWLLRRLLDEGDDSVLYLDPDIQVFASLEPLSDLARERGIVLTPHMLAPPDLDGLRLDEKDVKASGIYNLGFLGVGRQAIPMLEWWMARLRRDCIVDLAETLFVDQRWMDMVPGYYEALVLRDPSYNVAYWNLHERDVELRDGTWYVGDSPLRFFHFSGYDPDVPWKVSKHQQDRPRIRFSQRPALRELFGAYASALKEAGFGSLHATAYPFNRLPAGIHLDRRIRRLYRRELLAAERAGAELPPNPFAPGGEPRFIDWLNEPTGYGPRKQVSRYLQFIYDDWDILRLAFPDLSADSERYLDWVVEFGPQQALIPDLLLPPRRPAEGAEQPPAAAEVWNPANRPRGVNLAGYLRADNGVGHGARLLVAALEAAGEPVTTLTHGGTPSSQGHAFRDRGEGDNPYDVNIICVNADMLPSFAWDVSHRFFDGHHNIGQWAWETEELPESMLPGLQFVHEVWTPSEYCSHAVRGVTQLPVMTFPHPIVAPDHGGLSRADLGLPAGYMFLFAFDLLSTLERKNPLGLVEAFRRAFRPGEGPVLVLRPGNGDRAVNELERLKLAALVHPDVVVLDGVLDDRQYGALLNVCDCYVSLHRSEGFGLTIAEAMALGRPAIATGYSGNLEFMNAENSYLVAFERVEVGDNPLYPPRSHWAEPDLDDAVRLMRQVFENPEAARERGARACVEMRERHSPAARAELIRRRLEQVRAGYHQETPGEGPPPPIEVAAQVLAEGPKETAPTRRGGLYGRAARTVRRAVLRSLSHYRTYENTVQTALLDAVRETSGRAQSGLESAARRQAMGETRIRAELDRLEEETRLLRARLDRVEAEQAPS